MFASKALMAMQTLNNPLSHRAIAPFTRRLSPWSRSMCSPTASSLSPDSKSDNGPRVFVSHTIYKGKAAMSISPSRPTFKVTENGDVVLDREGSVFMEFAPATGPKQYDWGRKQIIALSVSELGTLMGLLSTESCEFFHDPNINTSNAGKVRKALKVEAMSDKTGFFFNFSVVNKMENVDERYNVPVTKGEFALMRSAFNFIIPYLIGWHAYVTPLSNQLLNDGKLAAALNKVSPELEWSK